MRQRLNSSSTGGARTRRCPDCLLDRLAGTKKMNNL